MSIVGLLVLLLVIGVALAFVPMDPKIRQIIILVIALVVVLVLLRMFGLL